ncbi:hypothetical protein [Mycolicibacterium mageritense]|uniref:hypothetical protein n=1 Tax=Mycolicibacterium mageritense TaxID=53462 RepID=UPI0011D7CEE7|nr:hypothetical protein [Mycolicibacterium mageritense]TXI62484.1 MAG: hypothetical protein E6Q55_12740 [Mycolicibacterium mageritense]
MIAQVATRSTHNQDVQHRFSNEVLRLLSARSDVQSHGYTTVTIDMPPTAEAQGWAATATVHIGSAVVFAMSVAGGVKTVRVDFPDADLLTLMTESEFWWAARGIADSIPATADELAAA